MSNNGQERHCSSKGTAGQTSPRRIKHSKPAGEKIKTILTTAPGNGAPIGGLKLISENGWFAARPSGAEDLSKIYAQSFQEADQLDRSNAEA